MIGNALDTYARGAQYLKISKLDALLVRSREYSRAVCGNRVRKTGGKDSFEC
jgi:hypothetical protein